MHSIQWQVWYLRTCHSNVQLVSAIETLQETFFFWPSWFIGLFFLKHKWLIRRYFCCLFKETYSKKERKMFFVNQLKLQVQFDFWIRWEKCGWIACVDAIQNTCLWAIQTWLQSMLDGNTDTLSPKFAFVYLGNVLTPGRKQNSRYDKATQANTGR